MKKFFKNTAILALGFGFAMTFTACHNNGEAYVESSIDDLVTVDKAANTLTLVFTQNPSSVKIGMTEYASKVVATGSTWTLVIEGAPAKGTIKTTFADGSYVTDDVTYNFGAEEQLEIRIQGYKATSSTAITMTLGAGNTTTTTETTTNDPANQAEGQGVGDSDDVNVTASVTLPAGTPVSNGGTTLSIIVYTPSDNGATDVASSSSTTFAEPVLAVRCQPDGADFTPGFATVKVNIPNLTSEKIFLRNSANANETLSLKSNDGNGNLEVDIPHFSSWYYVLEADIAKIDAEDVEVSSGEAAVAKAGTVKVPFTKYVGYEIVSTEAIHPLVKKFIQSLFGVKKKTVNATFSFSAPSEGTLSWKASQHVSVYHFRSGQKYFDVRVYGSVKPTGTFNAPEEPEYVHSGGSNL